MRDPSLDVFIPYPSWSDTSTLSFRETPILGLLLILNRSVCLPSPKYQYWVLSFLYPDKTPDIRSPKSPVSLSPTPLPCDLSFDRPRSDTFRDAQGKGILVDVVSADLQMSWSPRSRGFRSMRVSVVPPSLSSLVSRPTSPGRRGFCGDGRDRGSKGQRFVGTKEDSGVLVRKTTQSNVCKGGHIEPEPVKKTGKGKDLFSRGCVEGSETSGWSRVRTSLGPGPGRRPRPEVNNSLLECVRNFPRPEGCTGRDPPQGSLQGSSTGGTGHPTGRSGGNLSWARLVGGPVGTLPLPESWVNHGWDSEKQEM